MIGEDGGPAPMSDAEHSKLGLPGAPAPVEQAEFNECMRGLFEGGRVRVQRVHTSKRIVSRLNRLWGRVACDPCSSPGSIIGAERESWPEKADDPDGLAYAWPPRTYANPPFADLVPWLAMFTACDEAILLCPTRAHRKWYRAACATVHAYVDLDPLAFLGHAQSFPAPLRILYRGPDPKAFAEIFGDLGGAVIGPVNYQVRRQIELFP